MPLYFVTAREGSANGWTVFGGHWYAETPKAAIAIAQREINSNQTSIGLRSCEGLFFKAAKSKAIHNALNKGN